jgi:WD40 repeat protein
MVNNDSIYDAFRLRLSSDGRTMLTGSYNNCFHLIDAGSAANTQYELNYRKSTICRPIDQKSAPLTKMDYAKKTIAADFSPVDDTLAVASLNCFFTYSL